MAIRAGAEMLSWKWSGDERGLAEATRLLHDQLLDLESVHHDSASGTLTFCLLFRAEGAAVSHQLRVSVPKRKGHVTLLSGSLHIAGVSRWLAEGDQGVRFYELVSMRRLDPEKVVLQLEPPTRLLLQGSIHAISARVEHAVVGFQRKRRWLGLVEAFGKIILTEDPLICAKPGK